MVSKRVIANVIFFFVGSGVLIALLVVLLFRVQPEYSVYVTFENTGGVFTGQEVTYRGFQIGQVGSLKVVEEGVEMELVIARDYDEIPKDTRARVMFKSAVGEQFVDLLPATADPPFFVHGDRIPKSRTQLPVQQEELLRLVAAVLDGVPPDDIRQLIDTLGTGLGGRGDELHLALRSLDPISAVLANRVAELNRLNINSDTVGNAFDRTSAEFETGIRHLETVSEALSRSANDFERLLSEGATSGAVLADLVSARKAEINQIFADLAQVTRVSFEKFEGLQDSINLLGPFLGLFLDGYDPELNRFRFGQINTLQHPENPPCDHGTPRRPETARGDAPYHPILEFSCTGEANASAATARPPASRGAPPDGAWQRILADTLRP